MSIARRRIGLVGCVKEKAPWAAPAKDLYRSTLFLSRRRFVERSCSEWWILSAEHGLVHPDDVLGPYDRALKDAGRPERRAWSARVLAQLDQRAHLKPGDVIELHAGSEYREFGLVTGLVERGCVVENPTAGMSIGIQLGFYKRANG